MNLYEACLEKFGVITAVMILADFSGFMADFNRANEEELKELIAPLNKDKDTDQIKSFVLEETGVETFGISTIGQAMLTAYAAYANSYVAFKHSFNMEVMQHPAPMWKSCVPSLRSGISPSLMPRLKPRTDITVSVSPGQMPRASWGHTKFWQMQRNAPIRIRAIRSTTLTARLCIQ